MPALQPACSANGVRQGSDRRSAAQPCQARRCMSAYHPRNGAARRRHREPRNRGTHQVCPYQRSNWWRSGRDGARAEPYRAPTCRPHPPSPGGEVRGHRRPDPRALPRGGVATRPRRVGGGAAGCTAWLGSRRRRWRFGSSHVQPGCRNRGVLRRVFPLCTGGADQRQGDAALGGIGEACPRPRHVPSAGTDSTPTRSVPHPGRCHPAPSPRSCAAKLWGKTAREPSGLAHPATPTGGPLCYGSVEE
jgi:hypothetical protein